MKFSMGVDLLDRVASQVQSITVQSNVSPIDSFVLIEVGASTARFTTTDRTCEFQVTVPILAEHEGAITVSAKTLAQIAKALDKDETCNLEFDPVKLKLTVTSGTSNYELQTLPSEDFPILANEEFDGSFSIEALTLLKLLDTTKFAISREDQRKYLKGVFLNIAKKKEEECLDAVATDGFKMALYSAPKPENMGEFKGVIIPEKAVNTLTRYFEKKGNITVHYTEQKIRFISNGKQFTSLLISGDFPVYHRLIPQDTNLIMSLEIDELVQALRKVLTVSTDPNEVVVFTLTHDKMKLKVTSMGRGIAETEIPVTYPGETLVMKFVANHLTAPLEVLGSGIAVFTINDGTSAIKLRKEGDENALFVIMPQTV